MDRRRARARRPADVDALVDRLAALRRRRGRRPDLLPPEPAARWRCCCAWPACRASPRHASTTPASLLDVRHARRRRRATRSSARCRWSRPLGFACPPATTAGWRSRPASAGARPFAGEPYVVVHPGASVPARAWAPERHARARRRPGRARAGEVVVTGAPAERALTARVAGSPRPGVADLGGRTTSAELAGVLAGGRRGGRRQHRPGPPGRRRRARRWSRCSPRWCPPSAGARGACRTGCSATRRRLRRLPGPRLPRPGPPLPRPA